MDERTRVALEGSIEKWQRIVDGTGGDRGVLNCPLCVAFIEGDCQKCPVYATTEKTGCNGTPYIDWDDEQAVVCEDSDHQRASSRGLRATTPRLVELARAELEFLKSLREKNDESKAG